VRFFVVFSGYVLVSRSAGFMGPLCLYNYLPDNNAIFTQLNGNFQIFVSALLDRIVSVFAFQSSFL